MRRGAPSQPISGRPALRLAPMVGRIKAHPNTRLSFYGIVRSADTGANGWALWSVHARDCQDGVKRRKHVLYYYLLGESDTLYFVERAGMKFLITASLRVGRPPATIRAPFRFGLVRSFYAFLIGPRSIKCR
jgi:hypothetical protein